MEKRWFAIISHFSKRTVQISIPRNNSQLGPIMNSLAAIKGLQFTALSRSVEKLKRDRKVISTHPNIWPKVNYESSSLPSLQS